MRATSRKPSTRVHSKAKYEYESKPPAMIIGAFKLVDADKMVEIITARPNPFRIQVAAEAKRAIKVSGKTNQAARYGMALVQWKKKDGTDATVTWYRSLPDLKLTHHLSIKRGQDIYGRWLG